MLALHLGRRKDAGTLRPDQVSLGKLNNVREALDICRTARTILCANGVSLEYPIIRHMNNLESVLTYEGTVEMHTLVVGQAMAHARFVFGSRVQAGGASESPPDPATNQVRTGHSRPTLPGLRNARWLRIRATVLLVHSFGSAERFAAPSGGAAGALARA